MCPRLLKSPQIEGLSAGIPHRIVIHSPCWILHCPTLWEDQERFQVKPCRLSYIAAFILSRIESFSSNQRSSEKCRRLCNCSCSIRMLLSLRCSLVSYVLECPARSKDSYITEMGKAVGNSDHKIGPRIVFLYELAH